MSHAVVKSQGGARSLPATLFEPAFCRFCKTKVYRALDVNDSDVPETVEAYRKARNTARTNHNRACLLRQQRRRAEGKRKSPTQEMIVENKADAVPLARGRPKKKMMSHQSNVMSALKSPQVPIPDAIVDGKSTSAFAGNLGEFMNILREEDRDTEDILASCQTPSQQQSAVVDAMPEDPLLVELFKVLPSLSNGERQRALRLASQHTALRAQLEREKKRKEELVRLQPLVMKCAGMEALEIMAKAEDKFSAVQTDKQMARRIAAALRKANELIDLSASLVD